MQENEEAFEAVIEYENDLKKQVDRKYTLQNANRVKLQKNINESLDALKLSQKKIKQGTFLMENSKDTSHASKKKGGEADKAVVDVEGLLETLRRKIVDIYKREIG